MQEQSSQGAGARPAGGLSRSFAAPSSSRMLTRYLNDVEQLLEEQHWDAALREAGDLPRIAVALSDPQLRCAPEALGEWCEQWGHPADGGEGAASAAHLSGRDLCVRTAGMSDAPCVPTRALRRLQLRRHLRTPPRGHYLGPLEDSGPRECEPLETGRALVQAVRRWYAHRGCHDATVQANLARLAVLR